MARQTSHPVAIIVATIGLSLTAGAVNAVCLIAPPGQDASSPVAFEVAVVKVNKSVDRLRIAEEPGGRFTATNVPLGMLITYAYQISYDQLVSGPDWIGTERFDIMARLDHEPPEVPRWEPGERRLALRTLLAERFKLEVKRETREVPMYALVMARPDGRPGPKLTPSQTDCSPAGLKTRSAATQAGQPVSGLCGSQFTTGRLRFGGYPMSEFVKVFSSYNGRAIIDRTGLKGSWDIDVTYMPEPSQTSRGQDALVVDPSAPSLPTAFQEQLGLKLEPTRGPREVMLVNRVERPSKN